MKLIVRKKCSDITSKVSLISEKEIGNHASKTISLIAQSTVSNKIRHKQARPHKY